MQIIKTNSEMNNILRFPNCNDNCSDACCAGTNIKGSGATLYTSKNRSLESK